MTSLLLPPPGSRSKVLRHLHHIEPLKKQRGGKFAKQVPFNKTAFVQPHDRVAFWNITPGDEVRVRVGGTTVEDKDGVKRKVPFEGIVDTIDRTRNVAWLRAPEDADETLVPRNMKHIEPRYKDPEKGVEGGFGPNVAYIPRPIHYSNLQLKLPSDLKLPTDVKLDLKKGVYANRLTRSEAGYDKERGHFVWRRYAIVRTEEGTLKIEVPWKKGVERSRPRKENTTLSYSVDNETWRPWNPESATWLLPFRKPTSPQAIERFQYNEAQRLLAAAKLGAGVDGRMSLATAAARAAARAANTQGDDAATDAAASSLASLSLDPSSAAASAPSATEITASMLPGSSTSADKLPVYQGFIKQFIKNPKAPKLPQPATPAEQLWMARHDLRQWRTQEAAEESSAFSAFDYLDIAPIEAGLTDRSLRSGTEDQAPRRNTADGRLADAAGVDKASVDSWPIELMMKDDLMNEQGSKHRRLRWRARQEEKAAFLEALKAEDKANLRLFRSLDLRKKAVVSEAEEAAPASPLP